MAKIKISQKQYDAIILHEHNIRINKSSDIISEEFQSNLEILNEGWKEVVLGVAMMMGIGLTGQNKIQAQNAVKNAETMAQIKSTLEDENKTKELVDLLKEKGMKDPETKLAQNAEQVVDAFNRIAADDHINYKVDLKVVNNLQALKGKLGQGYAVKNAEIKNDTIKGDQGTSTIVTISDTLEIELGNENLFVTAGFTLSQAGVDTITTTIDAIKKQGGKIESVDIESSTDSEEIAKFKSQNDPTGNIKLSNLRTQSVSNLISSLDSATITHREIPNNGSNIVSTQQFKKAANDKNTLTALRDKTKEFRYVKIKIVVTFEKVEETAPAKPDQIIKNYRFDLVKVIESAGKTHKISTKTHFKHKKFKCSKKKNVGGKIVDACSTF